MRRLLNVATLVVSTVTGCNFVTNNYTLDGTGGGAGLAGAGGTGGSGGGSSSECSLVFRDDFEEPLTVNWILTGEPEMLNGQVELSGTDLEKLESRDTFSLLEGGCVTLKIDELILTEPEDRGIVFLTNPEFTSNFTMTGNGLGELTGGDVGSASVLTGLRDPDGALRGHWRICVDTEGLAHYFASVDGVDFEELDDREDRFAGWDVTTTMVALEAFPAAGSSATMTVDWVEVCTGYP